MSRYFLEALAESLDSEELDELHDALLDRNGDNGPLLDSLHGLITAVLVGPLPVEPTVWVPLILSFDEPPIDPHRADYLRSLCLRLYLATERGLEQLTYEPILSEYEDEEDKEIVVDTQGWCAGFAMGVDLHAVFWEERLRNDPQLMEIMAPILALAFSDGLFEDFTDPHWPPLSENEREACIQMIPSCIIDLQHYWREHPPQQEMITAAALRGAPRKRGGRWVH